MRVITDEDNEVKFTVIAWHCPLQINWSSITADDWTTRLSDGLVITDGYWYRGWTILASAIRVHCSHLKHVLSARTKFSQSDTGVSDEMLSDRCPWTIWCFVFHQISNNWTKTFNQWRLIRDCAAVWLNITYSWCHRLTRFTCHTTAVLTVSSFILQTCLEYTNVECALKLLQTSVSETILKPPLVKAQTALKKNKK